MEDDRYILDGENGLIIKLIRQWLAEPERGKRLTSPLIMDVSIAINSASGGLYASWVNVQTQYDISVFVEMEGTDDRTIRVLEKKKRIGVLGDVRVSTIMRCTMLICNVQSMLKLDSQLCLWACTFFAVFSHVVVLFIIEALSRGLPDAKRVE